MSKNNILSISYLSIVRQFFILLLSMFAVYCHADIVLKGEEYQKLPVGHHLHVLEDRTGTLELESILENPDSYLFSTFISDVPSFGYTKSTYWARFKINNESDKEYDWILEIPYAPLDSVTLYIETEQGFIKKIAGDSQVFSKREIEFPTPAFFFETKPKQTQRIYIQVTTTSSLQIPVVLWSHKGFISNASTSLLFWGIYFGTLLIAAGYNLFLYMSLKDSVYAYYVGFVLMVALFQLSVQGFSSQHLWPNNPEITNIFLLTTLNAMGIFGGIFSIHFLRLKESIPALYQVVLSIVVVMVINILVASLAPYRLVLRISILFFATGTIALLIAGCISWAKGYTPARIYVFAWVAMLGGAFTFSLKTLGLIPTNTFTHYAVTIGSAIEVILLSLAIGDRINLERKEKQAAKNRFFDVQKELLHTKQESLENAQLSDQKKQEFLATMSHELRTPLNGILGCSQLLQESNLSKEDSNTVSFLASSSKQMLSHVNRILNFSQLHEGSLIKEEVIFDINSIATAINQAYRTQCIEKSLDLEVSVQDSANGIYKGDKQKTLMILSDLLENAIKFTSKGSIKVEITTQQKDAINPALNNIENFLLTFSVIDTGCGIDPKSEKDIFKMFSQEDGSFKRSYEGLGLGLAICKKYVELLGGEIHFDSKIDKGSTFYVELPFTKCLKLENDRSSNESQAVESHQKNILIVEDNPTNQIIVAKMLKKLGYKYQMAENGKVALELLEDGLFDLILMDCQMPQMDGFEATAHIRSQVSKHQNTPIIAVTANAMAGDREHCLRTGMNDYIAKPFSKDLLASKLMFWFLNHPDRTQ